MQHASFPRRSNRVSAEVSASDGDLWREKVTVCESSSRDGKPKLHIRSYFINSRTLEKVWDEPPSGAGQVQHASIEMRNRASAQLHDLQQTLEMIPKDHANPCVGSDDQQDHRKKRRGFNLFRKREKKSIEDAKDLNLQRAIAQSVMSSGAKPDESSLFDELETAQALSLSTSCNSSCLATATEDEMLEKALAASRLDAYSVTKLH